ncbi:unnamed protein product [Euphydryas editha]|uniref:Uncharacterized protein n=1 Tax=Euphydryas editha TaxID=104508 RepID=A0AAU9TEE1_EUPED|nr:unnamed protein product [Euphydryas editha]
MFWSGNYIAVRELKFLLKEENVTLTQVLEADDILQECQADNKALIQFLTRPDILAELITHVTEEPSKNVELALQYRYANTASEVMASNISTLRDRLSTDVVQMNRLCDFVATDTTLNPLLSSFYSKTIDMLLQRNPKQDGYLHHIVSLRVLDFFKSRRDFLPNLLRNISTSAICDIFKMFLALKDPFNKIIIEWFDEHQFLESLIQIICGTYGDPPPKPATITTSDPSSAPDPSSESGPSSDSGPSSASVASSELAENVEKGGADDVAKKQEEADAARKEERGSLVYSRLPTLVERYPFFIRESGAPRDRSRMPVTPRRGRSTYNTSAVRAERQWRRRFAARNAAALLCDVAADACCGDGAACGCGARALRARLRAEDAVRRLLQAVFTAPPAARRPALEHACDVLLALLRDDACHKPQIRKLANVRLASYIHVTRLENKRVYTRPQARRGGRCGRCGRRGGEEGAEELERAVAPHLPLLHHALLRADEPAAVDFGCDLPRPWRAVGTERLAAAALLARLARSAADDVPNALVTLGTPGVLIDMFFEYPNNNFLHKSVCALVRNACANPRFGDRYTAYLIGECNLLERFMKAFEENENLKPHQTRAGYMGHLIEALRNFDQNPPLLDSDMQLRWDTFRETRLRAVLAEHDTPLGGVYPSENTYEFLAKADAAADPEVAVEEEANGHLSVSFARLLHECRSRFARMSDDGQASVDRVSHECRQRVTQGSPECRSRVARMSGHGRTSVARVLPECRAMVA